MERGSPARLPQPAFVQALLLDENECGSHAMLADTEKHPVTVCPKVMSLQLGVAFEPHAVTFGGLAAGLPCHNAHADVSGTQLSQAPGGGGGGGGRAAGLT